MKNILFHWLTSLPRLFKISLMLASPASLPYSPGALLLTLLSYIAVGYFALGAKYSLLSISAQVMIEIAILAAISYFFLKLKHRLRRFLQTLYALIGVNLVISAFSLLLLKLLAPAAVVEPGSFIVKAELLIMLWNLAAVSLVFQRAFEIRTLLAAFAAFNYMLLYQFLLLKFF